MHNAYIGSPHTPEFRQLGDCLGVKFPPLLCSGTRHPAVVIGFGKRGGITVAIHPQPVVFVDDAGEISVPSFLLAASHLIVGGYVQIRQGEVVVDEQIGMAFLGIGFRLCGRPAVVPRPVLQVMIPDGPNGGGGGGAVLILILHIPLDDRRMVTAVVHPLERFRNQCFGGTAVVASAEPGEFVHDQEAFLVGNIIPEGRGETDMEAEHIPAHILEFPVQRARPVFLPRMLFSLRVLIKAVHGHIGPAQIIDFAVEHRQLCLGIVIEGPHTETAGIGVARGYGFDLIKIGIVRGPLLAFIKAIQRDLRNRQGDFLTGLYLYAGYGEGAGQPFVHDGFAVFVYSPLINPVSYIGYHIGGGTVLQRGSHLDPAVFQVCGGLQGGNLRVGVEDHIHAVRDARVVIVALRVMACMGGTIGIVLLILGVAHHDGDIVDPFPQIGRNIGGGGGIIVRVFLHKLPVDIDIPPVIGHIDFQGSRPCGGFGQIHGGVIPQRLVFMTAHILRGTVPQTGNRNGIAVGDGRLDGDGVTVDKGSMRAVPNPIQTDTKPFTAGGEGVHDHTTGDRFFTES